jgi:hypothetical protein
MGSDGSATVPADYTFTAGDSGTHAFANGVTLLMAGSQTVTATDMVNLSISGSATVSVVPAQAVSFAIAAPAGVSSGTSFDITITALDPYGNIAVNYQATVTFTSSDLDAGVVLPADYTFQSTDAGTHTFPAGVTLITPGDKTLTVTDAASGDTGIATVTVAPGSQVPPAGRSSRSPRLNVDITASQGVQAIPELASVDWLFASLWGQKKGTQ